MSSLLADIRKLSKKFLVEEEWGEKLSLDAVSEVSFSIFRGETLGLVGETGCGKSTLGRCILRLLEPSGGEIIMDGRDILRLPLSEFKSYRRRMQIVFQDPFASLSPRKNAYAILEEPLIIHGEKNPRVRREKVEEIATRVGLEIQSLSNYPHEFSGGQRQRIGIARALILQPEFVVCDEPVSALDVSIQAQILNLLSELQETMHLTYLFISHDLSVVRHISNRIAVMYMGKIVEIADKEAIFATPLHPYTRALLTSVPIPNPRAKRERVLLEGDPPSPFQTLPGCRFHTRCPLRMDICTEATPELRAVDHQHLVACHLYGGR
jgi:oligopeptide/dipeptide ABC transporter ATP-binding protein